jgi:hypothetical protein
VVEAIVAPTASAGTFKPKKAPASVAPKVTKEKKSPVKARRVRFRKLLFPFSMCLGHEKFSKNFYAYDNGAGGNLKV